MKFFHIDCDCGNPACGTRQIVCANERDVTPLPDGTHALKPGAPLESLGKVALPPAVMDGVVLLLNVSLEPTRFAGAVSVLEQLLDPVPAKAMN